MMKIPTRRSVLTILFVAAAAIVAGVFSCRIFDYRRAANILNIVQLPDSVSNIDCVSYGFSDVLVRCAFNVAPNDFDALLRGYQYVESAACGPESLIGGPSVGRDFIVVHNYVANPKEFEHGGNVTVLADRGRSTVMIDIYIE